MHNRLYLVGMIVALLRVTAAASDPPPQRVYESRAGRFVSLDDLIQAAAAADVVFIGEQHDDPDTHILERVIVERLSVHAGPVRALVLGLEMFERDVQPALDSYLAFRTEEAAFLSGARPWPRYQTDYRALVELARENRWKVVATNVPRRLAGQVARDGLATLEAMTPDDRRLVAREVSCPKDAYFERFERQMRDHGADPKPGAAPPSEATAEEARTRTERYYHAQCVKDETMAESVAALFADGPRPLVVHVNGAFHSDQRFGAAARTTRRLPAAQVVVISVVPVADLDTIAADALDGRADYLVFTKKPVANPAEGRPRRAGLPRDRHPGPRRHR